MLNNSHAFGFEQQNCRTNVACGFQAFKQRPYSTLKGRQRTCNASVAGVDVWCVVMDSGNRLPSGDLCAC